MLSRALIKLWQDGLTKYIWLDDPDGYVFNIGYDLRKNLLCDQCLLLTATNVALYLRKICAVVALPLLFADAINN